MILVDTSVLIDMFKGHKNDAVSDFRKITEQQIPYGISSIIFQEVLQGAQTIEEYNTLNEYLSSQRFYNPKDPVLSYAKAAEIYFNCRKKGVTIRSTIECLIARIAIEHDLLLLHNDKDFLAISSITGLRTYR